MQIIKTSPRQWQGNGFGTASAEWGVADHPDIRVKRQAGLWIAYGGGIKRTARQTKAELEQAIITALREV